MVETNLPSSIATKTKNYPVHEFEPVEPSASSSYKIVLPLELSTNQRRQPNGMKLRKRMSQILPKQQLKAHPIPIGQAHLKLIPLHRRLEL